MYGPSVKEITSNWGDARHDHCKAQRCVMSAKEGAAKVKRSLKEGEARGFVGEALVLKR